LHVVDISNPQADNHILTVYETLKGLDITDKPVITAFNKIDKLENIPVIKDLTADVVINISAKKDIGFDNLSHEIAQLINQCRLYVEKTIPYSDAGIINKIRKTGTLLEEEYREDGIFVKAYVDRSMNI